MWNLDIGILLISLPYYLLLSYNVYKIKTKINLNNQKSIIWLKRVLKNAWHNIIRNKILSIATILIISLIVFVFNLILALSYATESVILNVGEKLDISVEINSNIENYSIQALSEKLLARGDIKQVVFISKEDALARFSSKYPNVTSFLSHNELDNPLPNVLKIVPENISDNNKIIEYLEQPEFNNLINQQKLKLDLDQKSRNEKILDITSFIQKAGIWLNIIFAMVCILIIFNGININIHTHKNEIRIMRLVGATQSFIKGGYIFEGIIIALTSLLLSVGISKVVLGYLAKNLVSIVNNENLIAGMNAILLHFDDKFLLTLSWQILASIAIGFLSSYMAITYYLRKEKSY